MTPLRRSAILTLAVAAGFISFAATWIVVARGGTPLFVHPLLAIPLLVVAYLLWRWGRSVQRLKARKVTTITPTQAAKVALAARAGAVVAAVVTGHMCAQVAIAMMAIDSSWMRTHGVGAGVSAVSAIVLGIVCVVVETWCTIDDDDGASSSSRHATPA